MIRKRSVGGPGEIWCCYEVFISVFLMIMIPFSSLTPMRGYQQWTQYLLFSRSSLPHLAQVLDFSVGLSTPTGITSSFSWSVRLKVQHTPRQPMKKRVHPNKNMSVDGTRLPNTIPSNVPITIIPQPTKPSLVEYSLAWDGLTSPIEPPRLGVRGHRRISFYLSII